MRSILALLLVLTPATLAAAADPPPRSFPHPDRIRYDSHCLTIEGRDTFVYSGAFHYFRCPEPLWNDRFDKIKAAGFNAVETYVAWNYHEPAEPASVDDFSKVDLSALDRWLTAAEAHGLYVIIRPGPYICAEWDCGGFPQWLLTKKPADADDGHRKMWLRSDEPTFVAWSKHWYRAVDRVVLPHLLTRRRPGTGGIVLYQLENEYGGNQPDDVEVRYLHALGQQALDDGVDVPLFTCWTNVVRTSGDPVLRQAFDSCNFYPGWAVDGIAGSIHALDREQPDAPRMTTELQGGWFGGIGDAKSLPKDWSSYAGAYQPAQIQNLTLFAIQHGDTLTNYYMLFGGTDFGDTAAGGLTSTYDYSAPIRELGGVGEKYRRVAAIGQMLRDHGPALARSVAVRCDAKTDQADVTVAARRSLADGSIYLFVRTSQHAERRRGTAHVTVAYDVGPNHRTGAFDLSYDLEPFGSKIAVQRPDEFASPVSASLPREVPDVARPDAVDLPKPVDVTHVLRRDDPGPVDWRPVAGGRSLEQMGVDDRRFVFYRVRATVPDGPSPVLDLAAPRRDAMVARVNGSPASDFDARRVGGLRGGDNVVEVLYENHGQPNGGRGMEELSGVRRAALRDTGQAEPGRIADWRWHTVRVPAAADVAELPEVAADADDASWTLTRPARDDDATQLAPGEWGVFRATVDLTAAQLAAGPLAVELSRVDDEGWAFVNGQRVGHGADWATAYTFPAPSLHAGRNAIAVVVHNTDGRGGLGAVRLTAATTTTAPGLPVEVGLRSTGDAGRWFAADADDHDWQAATVGPPHAGGMLTWYRASFDLPAAKAGVWVPWVARLTLAGNGPLYLNGHPLGRYWAAGPQHDFFLPECWLNFGRPNVLAMCLRPTDASGTGVTSAVVVPVNELAERRGPP